MNKKNMVVVPVSGVMPEWLEKRKGIMGEIDRQLIQELRQSGTGLTLDQLQLLTEHSDPFVVNIEKILQQWGQFYKDIFSIEPDLSSINIPIVQSGFAWLSICLQEIPLANLWQAYGDQGLDRWSCYNDLAVAVTHNDRNCKNGSYSVWMRNCWEADEELKNTSAIQLQEQSISGCTLYERLNIGLFQWWVSGGKKGGRHLDEKFITLCSGSRDDDGFVPGVGRSDGKVGVCWCLPDRAGDGLRARQVVSS
ncbi:MAG: hypothetical protein Q8Q23_01150 [bacterium]|nr:hypothetical protein [bacterium]